MKLIGHCTWFRTETTSITRKTSSEIGAGQPKQIVVAAFHLSSQWSYTLADTLTSIADRVVINLELFLYNLVICFVWAVENLINNSNEIIKKERK